MLSEPDAVAVVQVAYGLDGSTAEWEQRVSAAFCAAAGSGLGCRMLPLHSAYSSTATNARRTARCRSQLRALCAAGPRLALASEQPGLRLSSAARLAHELSGEPIADWLLLIASDASMVGWIVACPLGRKHKLSRRHRLRWQAVAQHVLEAGRLRSNIQAWSGPREPRELLQRLAGSTTDVAAEESGSTTDGIDAWSALADGRWSIVEHFSADGRSFVVAKAHDAQRRDPRKLSPRERRVVELLANGCAGKSIAYELRLSSPSVSQAMHRAARKLGVNNAVELARLVYVLREHGVQVGS